MKAHTLPALLLGVVLTAEARAADWSSFEAAFPMFPCQDGWMGCLIGDQRVDPDLRRDAAGRPIPSDARLGWFDLSATPTFSPFVGLSEYEAPAEPEEVAAVERPSPSADQAAADAEAARTANLTAQREQREAEARRKEADARALQQKAAEDAARREAAEAQRKAALASAAAAAEERARLDREAAEAKRKAAEIEQQRKAAEAAAEAQRKAELAAQQKAAEELARQQKAEQARLLAEAAEREEQARLAKLAAAEALALQEKARLAAVAPVEPAKVPGAPVPAVADGDCSDTAKLEPLSLLGKLTEGTLRCLETRLANAPKMTDKKKISGVLMTDAWAKGDKEQWETLIKRHLDEIDQSDPDLCYKYALHLSRQGPGRASGVIRWANVALENRTVWIGETYTSRVYSLYKVRAAASQSLWQQAESEHTSAPNDETRDKVEKYRNMTKVNAREWFEYAKSSGKDVSTALQLCMSAAGTADYCGAN